MNLLWSELFDSSVVGSSSYINFCQKNESIVLASLPILLSELAGLSNFNEIFQLVKGCEGREIYLPKNSTSFHEISGVYLEEAIYQAVKTGIDSNEIIMSFSIKQRQLRTIKTKFK